MMPGSALFRTSLGAVPAQRCWGALLGTNMGPSLGGPHLKINQCAYYRLIDSRIV